MSDNKIISIIVDQVGMVYADPDTPIEAFVVNGEMAPVVWYRKGNKEYNGKYVIRVIYDPECKCSCHIKGLNGTHHEENCTCKTWSLNVPEEKTRRII